MTSKQAKAFRKDRVKELQKLATILQVADMIRDAGPLMSAAGQCGEDREDLMWGYAFAGLEFDLGENDLRHTRPNGVELDSAELSVSLNGPCLDEGAEDDPFTELNVNITVRGFDSVANELANAWHLDKHDGGESKFHHPNYHFHCGGEKIWECESVIAGFNYGSLLLLESPRLEHKPLDGILAVDFVLGNFLGLAWQKLKAEDEGERYTELIQAAEQRCHLACTAAALTRLRS